MQIRIPFVFFVLCLLAFPACKTGKVKTAENKKSGSSSETPISEKEQLEFDFLFFDAIREKILGNYPQAQQKFQQAIRIIPRNAAAHFELSTVYQAAGLLDLAENSALNAVRFDSKNLWYKRSLAAIYERAGKSEKMIPLLQEIVKEAPSEPEYQLALAAAYASLGKWDEALKVYDRIEKVFGLNEEIALQKRNVYVAQKKNDKAIEIIRRLMAAYPDEPGYHGYLAEVYMNMGQPEKALAEYEEIKRKDPDNPGLHFSLADFYRSQGNNQQSFEELKLAFANPEAEVELKLQVLLSYFELFARFPELTGQAGELSEILEQTHPEDARSVSARADYLLRTGKDLEALQKFEEVLKIDKSSFAVWNQVLVLLSDQKKYQEMFEKSKEAMELFPNQPVVFLMNGVAALQLKKFDSAAESFTQGAEITVDNPPLLSRFYASLGDTYYQLKRFDESDEAYEKALRIDSNDVYVLNNYAYFLSLRKVNLSRAKQMAEKVNTLNPGNPSYEDTYAWVLFQAGDFAAAAEWIDKALANGGMKNPVILEHKGDILFQLGKKQDALDFWKRAKELGGVGEKLDQKIEKQQYLE